MVHFRFVETIKNVYPILTSVLGDDLMHEFIREFIGLGANSPFIAMMPEEFGEFMRRHKKLKSTLFLEDLLWFEYGELDLLSKKFHDTQASLAWDEHYHLSSSCMVRSLGYRVHAGEFESPAISSLLLYYHFDEKRVYFEEITPFAQQLIEQLETLTLDSAVGVLAEMYALDSEVLRESVEKLIQKWCDQRVLTHYKDV
jgi:hypothetical protein